MTDFVNAEGRVARRSSPKIVEITDGGADYSFDAPATPT